MFKLANSKCYDNKKANFKFVSINWEKCDLFQLIGKNVFFNKFIFI